MAITESFRLGGGVKGHDIYDSAIPPFNKIFSANNLLTSWKQFLRGKKEKIDVAEFSLRLTSHLFELERDLLTGSYRHGGYIYFTINDLKPRDIHKASVRDRIVHHALYSALYPYFDRKFIYDSYSCRIGKGTHRALDRFATFARRESGAHCHTVWALSGDIKKCFASVDHCVLKSILRRHVTCPRLTAVLDSIIDSFSTSNNKGIPLGNLTSQLFINIYLNELDHHIKRNLKAKYYIRYADDFIIMSHDKDWLWELLPRIGEFLGDRLLLELRPNARPFRTVSSGVDFLGWVHFSHHRVLRSATRWRMLRKLERFHSPAVISSYLGLLSHGNTRALSDIVLNFEG